MNRLIALGLGFCLAISGSVLSAQADQQDAPPPLEQPAVNPQPPQDVASPAVVDSQPAPGAAALSPVRSCPGATGRGAP